MTGVARHRWRIALVHPFSWPEVRRGGERYLDDLAWYLAGAGHAVDIVTSANGRSTSSPHRHGTVHQLRRLESPRLTARGLGPMESFGISAYAFLRRHHYDLVHAFTPAAAVGASLARQAVVYTALGAPSAEMLTHRPMAARLLRSALRRADITTVLSASAQARVRAVSGTDATVLAPGVRMDAFPIGVDVSQRRPIVLFSSALDRPEKGLDTLLRAVAGLDDQVPGAEVWLSGPGDPSWACARLTDEERAQLPPVVNLGVGTLADVAGRFREAAVTALPSRDEAFGLVLIESLASGTPVVAASDAGMVDIVTDPAVGVAVPPGDPERLRSAIISILTSREATTSERCRQHAARWDWLERIGPAHLGLYERLASAG